MTTHRVTYQRRGATRPVYVTGQVGVTWTSHDPAAAATMTEPEAKRYAAELRRVIHVGAFGVEPVPQTQEHLPC